MHNFAELENKVEFLILYGSILNNPKNAQDIDIINISDKKKFVMIQKIIDKIQKTQLKKIHAINFTKTEFKEELITENKAIIDAVKKGIVLFGNERFIELIKELQAK